MAKDFIPALVAQLERVANAIEAKNVIEEKKLLLEQQKMVIEKRRFLKENKLPIFLEDDKNLNDMNSGDFRSE